jgi:multidrug resistance efflux pump
MGPPPMRDAIRRDAMARMQSIEARLSRIEARLAQIEGGRGGPGPRPEMTPEQREQMRKRWEEARERMREGGGPGPRPEMTPEQREQMEKRMQQARGRMEDARRKFQQMQERIRELEAEVARLKKGT